MEKRYEIIKNGLETSKKYSYENMVMQFTKIIKGEIKHFD